MSKIIVSEFVSYGHPDKIADQIGDALLDEYLRKDPDTKAGIEVLIKDNVVVLGGEVKCNGVINHDLVVREVFDALNFSEVHNLNSNNIKIINLIGQQSPEINGGVEQSDGVIGAGDQGFMVGFASNETTPEYLPIGVYLSKTICQGIANSQFLNIGPDVKTQVTVDYTKGEPVVKHILVSTMHPGLSLDEVRDYVRKHILSNSLGVKKDVFEKYFLNNTELVIDINPCGSWYIGGPVADCGVTGRKIVVDQFGGYSNVGGGGFSGKDGNSKVDRSAAYMARYIAKNIVASGIVNTCKVTLAYMIGVPEPSSMNIETDTNVDTTELEKIVRKNVDLTPKGISDRFDLKKPIYYITARQGHYGNSTYPWEKLDLVDLLK